MGTSEIPLMTKTKLNRIAWLSKQDSEKRFWCLMHLINEESLKACFCQLDEKKAVGIDGVDKMSYALHLDENIKNLLSRMKNMAYRPGPVRQVLIPKEGKPGATRPLGISNVEDKIVQGVVKEVLESIYEPIFLECSYGFRPGRGCHDAIKALAHYLYRQDVGVVIDVDLKNFFGSIDHEVLQELLRRKIGDTKFMRYINRMLRSGVLKNGELSMSVEGVPQGSVCSPVLANVVAHYVVDTWITETVKPLCKGSVALFRYADDMVICCQYQHDAERIKKALVMRLNKFKLQLNEEKTVLVSFDRKLADQGITQGTFDFLGFTFYLGKSRKGRVIPKLKTRAKTMRAKLNRVTEWAKQVRNKRPLKEIWGSFCSKLRGHIQYYGVSFNCEGVKRFLFKATKILFKWLNRRSQRKSFTWDEFNMFMLVKPLPQVRIVHRLF